MPREIHIIKLEYEDKITTIEAGGYGWNDRSFYAHDSLTHNYRKWTVLFPFTSDLQKITIHIDGDKTEIPITEEEKK